LILLPSTCFSIISFNSLKYHHRTHQSFPTRRSSDLVASAFIVRTMERRSSVVSSRLRSASMVCIGDGLEGFADAGRGEREDPLPDRKSTRLNSSHVKISYAVFCLKKKIIKPMLSSKA